MAGHSKFKKIMHRKGMQDKKRAKIFSKLIREITVAARGGLPDPDKNPSLRAALSTARAANMATGTIERALRRGAGDEGGANYEEVRYEGYGPGGVAIIVEALTDNRNRTAAEIRSTFSRFGGNLGETGSVGFLFERVGSLQYSPDVASPEEIFEAALEAGAEDVESTESGHEIICGVDDFNEVRDALEGKFGTPEEAGLIWRPQNLVPVNEEVAGPLIKLVGNLDESGDVQSVSANYDISDELLAKLTSG